MRLFHKLKTLFHRHKWVTSSFEKNGDMAFCLDCVRPEYTLVEKCIICWKRKTTSGWIVPDDETFELTPKIAGELLRNMSPKPTGETNDQP